MLPHGLLAVSIATTFLPELASAIKRNDRQTVLDRSSLGIRLIALVTLPAGFGMFVLRRAIVGAAFQHGKFTAANSLNTSRALAGFALGLVGFSIYLFVLRDLLCPSGRAHAVRHQRRRERAQHRARARLRRPLGSARPRARVRIGVPGRRRCGPCRCLHYKLPDFPLQTVFASLWRMALAALVMAEVVWVVAGMVGANSGSGAVVRVVVVDSRRGRRHTSAMLMLLRSPELDDVRSRLRPAEPASSSASSIRPMFKVFKKWWKYLGAKFNSSFDKHADPAVQLEQALTEAQAQHRRLKEQAANVIANQKQSELRLNSKMAELEKLNANARQALMMASDAEKAGDAAKAAQYNGAAETIANQLIQVEKDVEGLKTMVLDSAKASDQAKAAVQQNSRILQQKLAEKNKLLSQLEQAKMQEEMNKAMSQLQETVGDDVPTLNEVQQKIEARYVKAKASSELQESTVESRHPRSRAGHRQRRGAQPPQRTACRAGPRRPALPRAAQRRLRPSRSPSLPPAE